MKQKNPEKGGRYYKHNGKLLTEEEFEPIRKEVEAEVKKKAEAEAKAAEKQAAKNSETKGDKK